MKLSVRRYVTGLLLLFALATSLILPAALQGDLSSSDWTGWIVVTTMLALLFSVVYWMAVARMYAVISILTLWAWYLFLLVILAPCEGSRNFDRFRQMIGFGVWEFTIAIALVAIASSVVLYLRFRTVNGSPAPDQRKCLRLCVAICTVVSAPLAAGAYWLVPLLRYAHFGFGADLPAPTLALVFSYQYLLALPLACVAALLFVNIRSEYSEARLRIALNGVVGLIVLLNLASGAFVYAVFAPLRTLGCAV